MTLRRRGRYLSYGSPIPSSRRARRGMLRTVCLRRGAERLELEVDRGSRLLMRNASRSTFDISGGKHRKDIGFELLHEFAVAGGQLAGSAGCESDRTPDTVGRRSIAGFVAVHGRQGVERKVRPCKFVRPSKPRCAGPVPGRRELARGLIRAEAVPPSYERAPAVSANADWFPAIAFARCNQQANQHLLYAAGGAAREARAARLILINNHYRSTTAFMSSRPRIRSPSRGHGVCDRRSA